MNFVSSTIPTLSSRGGIVHGSLRASEQNGASCNGLAFPVLEETLAHRLDKGSGDWQFECEIRFAVAKGASHSAKV